MASDNPVRILIIEREQQNASTLRSMLEPVRGMLFEVRSSASVENSLSQVSDNQVDVVVYDLDFDRDGVELFVERLHTLKYIVPIVILANPSDEQRALHAFQGGAQDYLLREHFDGLTFAHVVRSARERSRIVKNLELRTQEFQANEARLLNVIINTADGIVVIDNKNIIQFMNPAARKLFGVRSDEMAGKALVREIAAGNNTEYTFKHDGEKETIVEIRTVETSWEGSTAKLISLRDITVRKMAETGLRKSEERYALAMRGSKDGLWDWNLKNDEVYFSAQWKTMIGYENNELGTSPHEWFKRVHKEDIQKLRADIDAHLSGKTAHFESEHRLQHQDGSYRWMLTRGTAVRDSQGTAVRIAGSQTDITERKEAEKNLRQALSDLKYALASEKVLLDELDHKNRELVELSITDGLTGLFNHRFIQERFDFEFKRAKRYDVQLCCMLLDIDHFKRVNDTYGHQFGDHVLREIAGILKSNSRDVDICGRYGGEEFMIVSNQVESGALQFASKLHSKIEGHHFEHEGTAVRVTVSIGIAAFTSDVLSKHELIERADTALYKAKEDGRNLIRVWKPQENTEEHAIDKGGIDTLKQKFMHLSSQVRASYMESTNALLRAVDAKDHYTYQHSQNVSNYAVEIGTAMGLSQEELEVLKYAGLLHDIGKIGVDETILVKRGSLSFEEFEILKKHSLIGVNILKDVQFLEKEIPIILHHHERYDGTGYPQGLRGREIPLGARILAVADAYDAMTTDREFKRKLSPAEAMEELQNGCDTQFTREIVQAFITVLQQKLTIDNNPGGPL